jgi:hypothetical protein
MTLAEANKAQRFPQETSRTVSSTIQEHMLPFQPEERNLSKTKGYK